MSTYDSFRYCPGGKPVVKQAASVEDVDILLDNQGALGVLEDLGQTPTSLRMAGRASGLSDALNIDEGLTVKRPRTANAIGNILGGLAGGLTGAVIGANIDSGDQMEQNGRMLAGGALGGAAGVALARLVTAAARRKEIDRIREEAKAKLQAGEKATSSIGQLYDGLPFLLGEHESGRADVAENVATKRRKFDNNLIQDAISLTGLPGMVINTPISAINYADAHKRLDRVMPNAVINVEQKPAVTADAI